MDLNFSGLSVCVVGDSMVDVYMYTKYHSPSYESGGQVLKEHKTIRYPGGAANVAMNLKTLGATTKLLSPVGDDESGQWLKGKLKEERIDWIPRAIYNGNYWRQTTTKTRVYQTYTDKRNEKPEPVCRIDRDVQYSLSENLIYNVLLGPHSEKFDLIVISDYQKGALSINPQSWISKLKVKYPNTTITANAKPELVDSLRGVDLLTVNGVEFEKIRRTGENERDLIERLGINALIHTKAEEGLVVISKYGDIYPILPHTIDFKDPIGAGDSCFAAASLVFALDPANPFYGFMGEVANAAGATKCQKDGTLPVYTHDILGFLRKRYPIEFREVIAKGLNGTRDLVVEWR